MKCTDCAKFYTGACSWLMDYADTDYAEDCVDFDNMRDILKRNVPLDVVDEEPSKHVINLFTGYCPRCKELASSYKEFKPRIFCGTCGQRLNWAYLTQRRDTNE